MCKVDIKDGELLVETRFSDRPLQIVKLDEITGLTIYEDPTLAGITLVSCGVSLLALVYALPLGILLALITLLLAWQWFNRGRITVLHARSHPVVIRGKHPELWEKIKRARKG